MGVNETLRRVNSKLDEILEVLLDDPQTSETTKRILVGRRYHPTVSSPSLTKKFVLNEL